MVLQVQDEVQQAPLLSVGQIRTFYTGLLKTKAGEGRLSFVHDCDGLHDWAWISFKHLNYVASRNSNGFLGMGNRIEGFKYIVTFRPSLQIVSISTYLI